MNNKKELTVEELQIKLSDVAAQYRSSEEDSVLHHQVLNEYYTIFNTLVELHGGIIGLDPDAELPDRLMPKAYVDFWLNGGGVHE